jgi:pimeloyl-ACP methyl ester carboxylesterase
VLVPPRFAGHVAAALPGARSVILSDCGHVPQFEHPQRTAALIADFLRRTASRPCAELARRPDAA